MKLDPPFEKTLAFITCANGHVTRLVSNVHSVAADGRVSPSYVCPIAGCTFHEFITLEGWTPSDLKLTNIVPDSPTAYYMQTGKRKGPPGPIPDAPPAPPMPNFTR